MKSIAGYNIIKLLAKGGMASIYLAEQASLKRQVVLKFLNSKLDEKVRRCFIDEGRIIASLKHPNIVTVFDVVSYGKYNFLAMEFLPDGDLRSRLKSKHDIYFSLNVISKISDALHLIHKQHIIHGDIKPENILFRGKNCPVLTDFGISYQTDNRQSIDLNLNEIYASPSYASPELIQGRNFDYRTDLYSLGVMMYEMLMAKKPFSGDTDLEVIANSIQQAIPQLSAELHELQPLLNSLLAKLPDERLSDAKLVSRFINHYLKEHTHLHTLADTKLIDTDVVVEYIADKKNKQKKYWFYSIFATITVLVFVVIFFNNDKTRDEADIHKSVQKTLRVTAAPAIEKINVKAIIADEVAQQVKKNEHLYLQQQKTLEKKLLLEKQQALEKKNLEIARVKKQLAQNKWQLSQKNKQLSNNIQQLLEKGQQALKTYQLTTPLNDNALYYYQKALELDNNNKEAEQGIKDIVYHYELLARSELDKYQYQKAQSYISAGLAVDSDNKRLLNLQKEANLPGEPARVINKVTNFFKNM